MTQEMEKPREATGASEDQAEAAGNDFVTEVILPGQGIVPPTPAPLSADEMAAFTAEVFPDVEEKLLTLADFNEAGDAVAPKPKPKEDWLLEQELKIEEEKAYARLVGMARAKKRFEEENNGGADEFVPSSDSLTTLLGKKFERPKYLINQLWPAGGNVILAAQRKAGKSTLIGNTVRSLVDGDTFLSTGRQLALGSTFTPVRLEGAETVFLLDFELPEQTLQEWLGDQRIITSDRLHVKSLRGKTSQFNILNDRIRAKWAAYFRTLGVKVLIIDPLAPLLAELNIEENDNTGVAKLFNALDKFKVEAGISEMLVAHHMGHNGERSRGASRLRDWPDAEWRLVREEAPQGQEPGPNAARFFSAEGRDVAVNETQLAFDRVSRRLTAAGGNRVQHAASKHEPQVVKTVSETPGIKTGELEAALEKAGVPQKQGRDARKALVANNGLHTHDGKKKATHYYVGICQPDACEFFEVDALDE